MYNEIKATDMPMHHASNLTELWWNGEQAALINLYSVTVGVGQPLFSDYDRFRALCHMMPYMMGHDEAARCKRILKDEFDITQPISPESCDAIWRATAQALLMNPRRAIKEAPATSCDADCPLDLPCIPLPALVDESFLTAVWDDYEAWQGAVVAWLDAMRDPRASVMLEDGFAFDAPHPYRVGQALQRRERDVRARSLLTAQLLRILCEELAKKNGDLHLLVGSGAGEDTVALLSYLEKNVGLPHTTWSTADAEARERLLAYSKQQHRMSLLPVLRADVDRPRQDLCREICTYARRFPVGLMKRIK